MASYDNSNNFYRFHCDVVQQQRYIAGCRRMLKRIADGTDAGMWPECAAACKSGACPTIKMDEEEMAAWDRPAIYYRDRDDCGPGVAQRAEMGLPARSPIEIAEHHAVLGALKLTPVSVEIGEALRGCLKPGASRKPTVFKTATAAAEPPAMKAAPIPGTIAETLELGSLINAELERLA